MKAISIVSVILLVLIGPQCRLSPKNPRAPKLQGAPATAASLHNPYAGQPAAVEAGRKLFRQHCAACHGTSAQGIGRAPGLSSLDVQAALPGPLFWYLTNGDRRKGMPSWSSWPEQRRWQVVTYLKSLGHGANP